MKKILVLEDEQDFRESLVDLLTIEGFSVISAANGCIGVQLARQHLPDLILCDVTMPQLDGYQVLTSLRQQTETAAIPFIFLTARGTKEHFRHGMELGANDFLTKPCTAGELLAAIASRFNNQAAVARQSQQQLDALRSSIALSLPHELRTPLNGILGLTEMLIDDYQTINRQEMLEFAQGIHDAAERLSRLIHNFLLYAELELTARDPDRLAALRSDETRLPDILIANVATAIAQRGGREADLHLELQNRGLQISDLKLKKIVEELVDNAFKFSASMTPIAVKTELTEEGLLLSVSDRGRGMTTEQIADLGAYMQFDRTFYEQQGSGLGLAIAKRLVELHGGTLAIESIPGQQTTVYVTLPRSED